MENNKQYVGALFISLAVVVFAFAVAFSAYNFSKLGSHVEVKGLSENNEIRYCYMDDKFRC